MDEIRSIIAVGGYEGHQSRFVTKLEPTKLKEDAEIAVTSIFHGQVFNINKNNNRVHLLKTDSRGIQEVAILNGSISAVSIDSQDLETVVIPPGFYPSSNAVCLAIEEKLSDVLNLRRRDNPFTTAFDKRRQIIQIQLENLVIKNKSDSPWRLLGITGDLTDTHEIENILFDGEQLPAFVYMNIIENSYINGRLSRISTVVPVKTSVGWSFFESASPNYTPINVREFSNILIELRDINGDFIEFDPLFKTIITLSVRPSSPIRLYKQRKRRKL